MDTQRKTRTLVTDNANLVPRVFVPYCVGLKKRATFESLFTWSTLIGLKKKKHANGRDLIKILRTSLAIHLKAGHAQFNRKDDIFGLQIVVRPLVKRNEDPGYEGVTTQLLPTTKSVIALSY